MMSAVCNHRADLDSRTRGRRGHIPDPSGTPSTGSSPTSPIASTVQWRVRCWKLQTSVAETLSVCLFAVTGQRPCILEVGEVVPTVGVHRAEVWTPPDTPFGGEPGPGHALYPACVLPGCLAGSAEPSTTRRASRPIGGAVHLTELDPVLCAHPQPVRRAARPLPYAAGMARVVADQDWSASHRAGLRGPPRRRRLGRRRATRLRVDRDRRRASDKTVTTVPAALAPRIRTRPLLACRGNRHAT